MTVRNYKLLIIGFVIATLLGAYRPAHGAEPQKQMNVLFLAVDDLNTWLLGDTNRYTGKVVAPNIQKLADSGVNFVRAYNTLYADAAIKQLQKKHAQPFFIACGLFHPHMPWCVPKKSWPTRDSA